HHEGIVISVAWPFAGEGGQRVRPSDILSKQVHRRLESDRPRDGANNRITEPRCQRLDIEVPAIAGTNQGKHRGIYAVMSKPGRPARIDFEESSDDRAQGRQIELIQGKPLAK